MHRLVSLLLASLLVSLVAVPAFAQSAQVARGDALERVLEDASSMAPLRTVVVARDGVLVAERAYRGASTTRPANIKSASKTVMSALVGIAIERGLLEGVDQPIAPLLADRLPRDPDPRLAQITIGHLLSMQAGLQSTSGRGYGRWVAQPDWVRAALAQPFVDAPGGGMIYSTGSTHLLSAVLARVGGKPVRTLAQEWLGPQAGFAIASWDTDPQGLHFGGNQMAMTPRALLAFGELYRNHGRAASGAQLVPASWIAQSWVPRTRSIHTGDGYGYGWFVRQIGGHDVRFAWGHGGQMLYIVPSLNLTVAMTSDETTVAGTGHLVDLHRLMARIIQSQSG
ncbi:serine hydrolase [Luteimonas sp. 3794]|uniref:serine hydrolase domain-containing protein n=1 Tax=Luteimonas sp. 3794 TaxID=2817730 RepID=UPI002857119F|nr:serine hydrolase [Luteimonas sp. 3794]MDR6992133.1 CubicO group peptidase (beta-lactamase class C family) [Luteimonas sp. 3794]